MIKSYQKLTKGILMVFRMVISILGDRRLGDKIQRDIKGFGLAGLLAATGLIGCQPQADNKSEVDSSLESSPITDSSDSDVSIADEQTQANTSLAKPKIQPTLDKIRDSGEIVLGHRDASIPFSYIATDPTQPVGYAIDLQRTIVEAIKKELDMPNLKVTYRLTTSQNRIEELQDGSIDLSCDSTSNKPERQKQVDFSVGFFVTKARILTHADAEIANFKDLKGKKVVTTDGTSSQDYLQAMYGKKDSNINLSVAPDHQEAFLMLENHRVDAMVLDDALLLSKKADARHPDDWKIVGDSRVSEIYGCLLRKNDGDFKAVVDNALKAEYATGNIEALYDKWFMQPIPPKNLNLNFPMSDDLKTLIDNPHDKAGVMNRPETVE